MNEETTTEVTTETSKVEQENVEINSATPEVEIPVQPEQSETESTTETRTETTTVENE